MDPIRSTAPPMTAEPRPEFDITDILIKKIPPHSLDMERAVLGAIMLEGDAMAIASRRTPAARARSAAALHSAITSPSTSPYPSSGYWLIPILALANSL